MKNSLKSVEDIKVGYVVELRSGSLLMCMEYGEAGLKCFASDISAILDINKNYTGFNFPSNYMYDVVRVYGFSQEGACALSLSTDFRDCLYKREESKKMTIKQIEKELGYKIELVSEYD